LFLRHLKIWLLLVALLGGAAQWLAGATAAGQSDAQLSPQWRPTQDAGGLRYVGSDKCAVCHDREAKGYHANGMSHTLSAPADTKILIEQPQLTFKNGNYTYTLARQGKQSLYRISDGKETLELPVLWAFGHAKTGQTYVLQHQGTYYESRVSYYPTIKGLDITLGATRDVPASLADAVGQPLKPHTANACFNCHSTPAPGATRFDFAQFFPGVGCEGCHGPGERHLALAKAGKFGASNSPTAKGIFNPARLSADELSQQFCGACHRSFEQVMTMPERSSVANIRFQPYRLAGSKCYQAADDPRISCVACHNPHEAVATSAAFYDAKCLACHLSKSEPKAGGTASAQRRAPACPTGKADCAVCHMPKIELPGSHYKFSDHLIRVVKPGESYPN